LSKNFPFEAYPCRKHGKYMNGIATLTAAPIHWSGPKHSADDPGRRSAGDAPTVKWTLRELILDSKKVDPNSDVFEDCGRWLRGKQAEIDRFFYADYI
jgi:hypothetical protein